MPLSEFRIIPALGLKTNVPQDDPTLFVSVGQNVFATYAVDGMNTDHRLVRNATTRATGWTFWDASETGEAGPCLGLFQLDDGTNLDNISCWAGKVFRYDGSRNPADISPAGVTLATDAIDQYSMIQYGSYVLIADRGEHTPYKWKNGDAACTKLIQVGTEYTFRYLEYFQQRILGLYSDQTNGDIELRWTSQLPDTATLTFAAANQLYRPNDDSFIGIKKMGHNACYLYGEKSIDRLDHYPDAELPFAIVNIIPDQGAVNQQSIVSTGYAHFCFNRNYGFCAFDGSRIFPSGGRPISEDIQPWIDGIDSDYYHLINGVFVPSQNEICWTVPISNSSHSSDLLYYHLIDKTWRREFSSHFPSSYLDYWDTFTTYTWNDLIAEFGGTGAIWEDGYSGRWADYVTRITRLVMGLDNAAGLIYDGSRVMYKGGSYATSPDFATPAYVALSRTEPILDFGDRLRRDLLLEVWVDLANSTSSTIEFYHRFGETAGEVAAASWTSLGTISGTSPSQPVLRLAKTAKLHQIKWLNEGTSIGQYCINGITFRYAPQGIW